MIECLTERGICIYLYVLWSKVLLSLNLKGNTSSQNSCHIHKSMTFKIKDMCTKFTIRMKSECLNGSVFFILSSISASLKQYDLD